MARPFHIVDVFAERAWAGNQLAVVLAADGLSDEAMQAIAYETNFSETTFVASTPERDGGHRVRIFTPTTELAFAGHPLLGTAWVIRHHVATGAPATVQLNITAGKVPVAFETSAGSEMAWFVAPPITLGPTVPRERIAAALGLSPDDIESRAPVQRLTAGNPQMIVPLRGLDALRRCRLDLDAYAPLAAEGFPQLVYLFCRETHDKRNDLCARFFFEANGVREDPATGSATSYLGAYLLEHRLIDGSELSLRIEQGYEMGRPSLVLLRARNVAGGREVKVGGQVVPVVRGELL